MKKNKNGSILIWSIFLVSFISFSFLYISNSIKEKIKSNNKTNLIIEDIDFNQINSKSIFLENKEKIEFLFFDQFRTSLKEKEKINISFLTSNTGGINLLSGGPLYYQVYSGSIIYSSGIVINSLNNLTLSGNLSLENLGGYANININFTTSSGIIFPYNHYKITKNIGGSNLLKESLVIK